MARWRRKRDEPLPPAGRDDCLSPERAEVARDLFAALTLEAFGERRHAVVLLQSLPPEALGLLFAISTVFIKRIAEDSGREQSEVIQEAALAFQSGLDRLADPPGDQAPPSGGAPR
jgi:hypothetical protein